MIACWSQLRSDPALATSRISPSLVLSVSKAGGALTRRIVVVSTLDPAPDDVG
jgi:hypothetical protein